jgi:signal transduction histidine kinase
VSKVVTMHRPVPTRPGSDALIDVLVAAVALGGTLAVLAHDFTVVPSSDAAPAKLDVVGGLLAVGASAPLVVWRRSPLGVFALTASVYVLLGWLGYPVGVPFGPTAALYLLAASRDETHPWTGRTTVAVAALLGALLGATAAGQGRFPASELFHTALAWGAAWFAGERTRLRREHVEALSDRALRAEREAEHERRLAVAEERARIARDLHDSAAHAINVIAVRAGAARLGHRRDPDRSLLALQAIEDVARRTVDDIDQIVGSLRDTALAGATETPPGLSSVGTLVAHHTASGLEVCMRTNGIRRELPSPVDQATYRILQEALTNASRHGAGAATVDLEFGQEVLELSVVNPVLDGSARPPDGGHGLVGMHERAVMVGGDLVAGRSDGAFRVHARLPYGIRGR